MVTFKVKKLEPAARIPAAMRPGDVGFDISTTESYTLSPGERKTFSTGIAVEFPKGFAALFRDRSGLGSEGIHALAGVIDPTYRGEWKVVLVNLGPKPYTVHAGDRIVQCIVQCVESVSFKEVAELRDSVRANGGFGSSGK